MPSFAAALSSKTTDWPPLNSRRITLPFGNETVSSTFSKLPPCGSQRTAAELTSTKARSSASDGVARQRAKTRTRPPNSLSDFIMTRILLCPLGVQTHRTVTRQPAPETEEKKKIRLGPAEQLVDSLAESV